MVSVAMSRTVHSIRSLLDLVVCCSCGWKWTLEPEWMSRSQMSRTNELLDRYNSHRELGR